MNIHEESATCIIYYHILNTIKASLIIISPNTWKNLSTEFFSSQYVYRLSERQFSIITMTEECGSVFAKEDDFGFGFVSVGGTITFPSCAAPLLRSSGEASSARRQDGRRPVL